MMIIITGKASFVVLAQRITQQPVMMRLLKIRMIPRTIMRLRQPSCRVIVFARFELHQSTKQPTSTVRIRRERFLHPEPPLRHPHVFPYVAPSHLWTSYTPQPPDQPVTLKGNTRKRLRHASMGNTILHSLSSTWLNQRTKKGRRAEDLTFPPQTATKSSPTATIPGLFGYFFGFFFAFFFFGTEITSRSNLATAALTLPTARKFCQPGLSERAS